MCVSSTRTMRTPASARGLEVRLDRERGVDHDRLARVRVADEVRAAAEVVVDELAEEHARHRNPAAPARVGAWASGSWLRPATDDGQQRCAALRPRSRRHASGSSQPAIWHRHRLALNGRGPPPAALALPTRTTAKILWRSTVRQLGLTDPQDDVAASPVLADGAVLLGGRDGSLYAIRVPSGGG